MTPLLQAWLILFVSIAAEVTGTMALRFSEGFTRPIPTLVSAAFYVLAVWLMSLVLKTLEVGLTYAVWAACGTALTALIGMIWFGESTSSLRFAGIGLIIAGVVLLNLSQPSAH